MKYRCKSLFVFPDKINVILSGNIIKFVGILDFMVVLSYKHDRYSKYK